MPDTVGKEKEDAGNKCAITMNLRLERVTMERWNAAERWNRHQNGYLQDLAKRIQSILMPQFVLPQQSNLQPWNRMGITNVTWVIYFPHFIRFLLPIFYVFLEKKMCAQSFRSLVSNWLKYQSFRFQKALVELQINVSVFKSGYIFRVQPSQIAWTLKKKNCFELDQTIVPCQGWIRRGTWPWKKTLPHPALLPQRVKGGRNTLPACLTSCPTRRTLHEAYLSTTLLATGPAQFGEGGQAMYWPTRRSPCDYNGQSSPIPCSPILSKTLKKSSAVAYFLGLLHESCMKIMYSNTQIWKYRVSNVFPYVVGPS